MIISTRLCRQRPVCFGCSPRGQSMAPLAPANKRIILIPIDDSEVALPAQTNLSEGCTTATAYNCLPVEEAIWVPSMTQDSMSMPQEVDKSIHWTLEHLYKGTCPLHPVMHAPRLGLPPK